MNNKPSHFATQPGIRRNQQFGLSRKTHAPAKGRCLSKDHSSFPFLRRISTHAAGTKLRHSTVVVFHEEKENGRPIPHAELHSSPSKRHKSPGKSERRPCTTEAAATISKLLLGGADSQRSGRRPNRRNAEIHLGKSSPRRTVPTPSK